MPHTAKLIKKRYEAAKTRQQPWHAGWRSAYRFTLPFRDVMDGQDQNPGQVKADLVFDSTGMSAMAHFANFIVSQFFPPMQDHLMFEPGSFFDEGEPGHGQRQEAEKALKSVTTKYRNAIDTSNFQTAISEFAHELGVGTASMLMEKGTIHNPFMFVAVPTPYVYLERGPWGGIGGHFQHHKVEAGLIQEQWPDAKLSDELAKKAQEEPTEEVELVSYTYWDEKGRVWLHDLITIGEAEEEKLLANPRAYKRRSPWITARWMAAPFEVYGRGPAMFALPDIKTANKVVEFILKNASLDIAGVYTGVDDGVLNPNTAIIVPGAVIPVARNHGHPQGASLAPLERSTKFDVAQLVLDDLRTSIKKAMMDDPLPPVQDPQRSATEFVMRKAEDNSNKQGAFGRLMEELIRPLAYRGIDLLDQLGLWQMPANWDLSVRYVKVRLVGPFAQALQLSEVANFVQFIELLGMLGPEIVAAGVKIEDAPEWLGKRLGIDPELLRSEEGREIISALVAALFQANAQGQGQPGAEARSAAVAGEENGLGALLGGGQSEEGIPPDQAEAARIMSGADLEPEGQGQGTETGA